MGTTEYAEYTEQEKTGRNIWWQENNPDNRRELRELRERTGKGPRISSQAANRLNVCSTEENRPYANDFRTFGLCVVI